MRPIEKTSELPWMAFHFEEEESNCKFLYLHNGLIVIRDIFPDQKVVFNGITDDWRMFCLESVEFAALEYLAKEPVPRAS